MSTFSPPWEFEGEPNQTSIRAWLDNLFIKFQPIEQARWNQSNIDSLFIAGEQRFINSYYNFAPNNNWYNFHFNIIQQPINMVTGYQRQHRKSITYIPSPSGDSHTTDQYTRLVMHVNNQGGILEKYSRACELACTSGMCLMQPYLDYTKDPVNGELDLKIWEYNSFLIDPFFREPDMSDANFVWCQQYMSKQEALSIFPDMENVIHPMIGGPNRYGRFYFLPENFYIARSDLLVMSYVWYRSKRKRKKLVNPITKEIFDFTGDEREMEMLLEAVPNLEPIDVDTQSWKLAVVLNDQLMWQGYNPLGFDECPLIPVYWNYDPQIVNSDLRVRSLTRSCRDAQFLLNRRIIINHDISESSINSGWLYKENSIANPENLRSSGQGRDLIIKDGYELTDVTKIIPNAVPPSDMALADQLVDMIYRTTGVSVDNLGFSEDKQMSGLSLMLRQGAGLVALQKYFDQWDVALKLLGYLELAIIQHTWTPEKVGMMLGEQPSPYFFSKMFFKYHILVAEGLNTTTQKQLMLNQVLEMNQMMGGVIPPRFILDISEIQGKDQIIAALDQQEQQAQAVQQQQQLLEQAKLDAQLKELYSKSAANISMARERHGRAESNIGLFEERLSEISRNRALATKDKMEALAKLMDVVGKYGEIETMLKESQIESYDYSQELDEDREKADAKKTALANDFMMSIMGNQQQQPQAAQQRGL